MEANGAPQQVSNDGGGASHTIYVNNLPEKVSQDGEHCGGRLWTFSVPLQPQHCIGAAEGVPRRCRLPPAACAAAHKTFHASPLCLALCADLKKAMRCMFGQFGNILDVVSRRTYRLRGQAWVVFERAEEAKKALDCMQGFPLMGKPLVRGFAAAFACRGMASAAMSHPASLHATTCSQ
jgi:RNA recognition motif-containing protein